MRALFPLLFCGLCIGVAADEKPPIPVTLASLSELEFRPQYSAPAVVLSLNDSAIGSQTAGAVEAIPVRVGDEVAAGDPLVRLDCRDNRIRVRQQQAALEAARSREELGRLQLQRARSLSRERNVSEELLNQRESELRSARADQAAQQAGLEAAELDQERCSIQAPFPGLVMERLTDTGEWIGAGQPVVRLLDHRRVEVSAQIPLDRVAALAQSQRFAFESDDSSFDLRLRRLVNAVDSRGRHREARFEFTADAALPGSSGRLIWPAAQPHIPADLPVQRDGVFGVFVMQEGRARFHPLTAAIEGQPAAVDLPPDSQLILEGRFGLQPGDPVVATGQNPPQ